MDVKTARPQIEGGLFEIIFTNYSFYLDNTPCSPV